MSANDETILIIALNLVSQADALEHNVGHALSILAGDPDVAHDRLDAAFDHALEVVARVQAMITAHRSAE